MYLDAKIDSLLNNKSSITFERLKSSKIKRDKYKDQERRESDFKTQQNPLGKKRSATGRN